MAEQLVSVDVAEEFSNNHSLVFWRGDFYQWDGKVWRQRSRDMLGRAILEETGARSARAVREVLDLLQLKSVIDSSPSPPFRLSGAPAEGPLSFGNGTLLVDRCVRGLPDSFIPHHADLFVTACRPYDYIPGAVSEPWREFIGWFTDRDPQVEALLQDFLGWCLLPQLRLEKLLWLVGSGANGKSVFCEVVRHALHDVSSVPLDRLAGRFDMAHVKGLLNICSEPSRADKFLEGRIKDYVSEGEVYIEKKHVDERHQFVPKTRLLIVSNQLPYVADRSAAFWRRLLLVRCQETVEQPDVELVDCLSADSPAVFDWILQGAQRVWRTKQITKADTVEDEVQEEKRQGDAIGQFLVEMYEAGTGREQLFDMFTRFESWRLLHGVLARSESRFNADARVVFETYPEFKGLCNVRTRPRINGVRRPCVDGIRRKVLGNRLDEWPDDDEPDGEPRIPYGAAETVNA